MDFKEILNRKIKHYGKTEAAYEFAAEEYGRELFKQRQSEQLLIQRVSQCNELFCVCKTDTDVYQSKGSLI